VVGRRVATADAGITEMSDLLLTLATPRKGQVVPTPRAEPRRHGASQENLFPEPELCRYSNADRETTLPRFVAGLAKCQVSALRNSSHLP
jgi:hypothetical protein